MWKCIPNEDDDLVYFKTSSKILDEYYLNAKSLTIHQLQMQISKNIKIISKITYDRDDILLNACNLVYACIKLQTEFKAQNEIIDINIE